MTYRYSMQTEKENSARALGLSLPISNKQGIEICNFIRRKKTSAAKKVLEEAIAKKCHIPFKRFTAGAGHKKGISKGPGKYPVKACQNILKTLKSAESNAQFKGLNTENLVIKHISCQKAPSQPKYGRIRGRSSKRAHVEIIVEEREPKKTEKKKTTEKKSRPETKEKAEQKGDEKRA